MEAEKPKEFKFKINSAHPQMKPQEMESEEPDDQSDFMASPVQELEEVDENESIYDQFADIKMETSDMQNCWLVLGELFYHYEAGEFVKEITPETHGRELFDQYCEDVNQPIAIETVINRIKGGSYMDKE